jgi:alpha/beta superfamily hydrolase
MSREKKVMINSRIESRVKHEPSSEWCAIITHPHPKLGGDLDNNVVSAIQLALQVEIPTLTTIRFNTRGVGESLGSSTWQGVDERQDLKDVIDFALQELSGVKKIVLIAYSFGAAVGLSISKQLCEENKLHAIIAIGYPKGFWARFIFHSHYGLTNPHSDIPKLFILGDADNFTSVKTLQTLVDQVQEPKSIEILPGLNHFAFGEEHRITELVVKFIQQKVITSSSAPASANTGMEPSIQPMVKM